jgi:hypothetical protein
MSFFFTRYKFYKSFKVPIIPEDKLFIKFNNNAQSEVSTDMKVKDINLTYISILTDKKITENNKSKLTLSHKTLLISKQYHFEATIIGSHMNDQLNKYISVFEIDDNNYKDFVLSFIEGFKKKRLTKYLLKSSLEDKEFDIEEISEIISLMKNGFHTLIKTEDINYNTLLENCNDFLKSSDASFYLINSSDNMLERKFTTLNNPTVKHLDYRKGIPGIVFSSGELINIYKSKLISIYPSNDTVPESVLAAPIFNRHKNIIGVLEFINKKQGKRFDLSDEKTISMLSIVFSSFYQMYNPVNSSSKLKRFNPGLNKEIEKIFKGQKYRDTLSIIDKVKNKLESILINSTSSKSLDLLAKEIIETSQFHDWKVVLIDCREEKVRFKHVEDQSILYLKEISYLSKEHQDVILDLVERKNIWIISTYNGKVINTENLKPEFHTIIAKHHINVCHDSNELNLTSLLHTFISTQKELKTYDEKVKQFEQSLRFSDSFELAN